MLGKDRLPTCASVGIVLQDFRCLIICSYENVRCVPGDGSARNHEAIDKERKSCSTIPIRLAQVGNLILAEHGDVVAEQIDQAARRRSDKNNSSARGLAAPDGPVRNWRNGRGSGNEVAQESPGQARNAIRHFRTEPSSAPFDVGRGRKPETGGPQLAGFAATANPTK